MNMLDTSCPFTRHYTKVFSQNNVDRDIDDETLLRISRNLHSKFSGPTLFLIEEDVDKSIYTIVARFYEVTFVGNRKIVLRCNLRVGGQEIGYGFLTFCAKNNLLYHGKYTNKGDVKNLNILHPNPHDKSYYSDFISTLIDVTYQNLIDECDQDSCGFYNLFKEQGCYECLNKSQWSSRLLF